MKTSVEFSYRKPVLTSLIIFTITFVLLHFEAFGNPVRTIAWKHHFILAYSLIAGFSFFIYYALFSTIINSKKLEFMERYFSVFTNLSFSNNIHTSI